MINETKLKQWNEMPFEDCLQKVKVGRDKQVMEKEYLMNGEYPIVDQGQSAIAGYTNDKNKVISDIQPFIIFGDHTRILKYIDFPIALGADGTKVIKPKNIFDEKFFFFYLKHLDVPSRGYNRHYTILKEKNILQPSLPEQKSIASKLSIIQEAISSQEELIAKIKELKQSMMQYLFTRGTKGEKTKTTEIGVVPESWNVIKLSSICQTSSGGTPSRANKKYYSGSIPWFKSGEMNDGYIDSSEESITEEAIKKSSAKIFTKGTLLVAMYGATAGKTAILKNDATTNQAICAIFENENINLEYLRHFLIFTRDYLLDQRHGGAQPNLSQTSIQNLKLSLPSKSEQEVISNTFITINKKIDIVNEKLSIYQNLFKTLLHELMSGERRVNTNK